MTLRHITYATAAFQGSARELAQSFERFGIDSEIYGPRSKAVRNLRDSPQDGPGAGYWRWKPYIVRDALEKSEPGDLVFYTDAGMTLLRDPGPLVDLAAQRGTLLFSHPTGSSGEILHPMSAWTKRDCFVLLGADDPLYWNANQLLGGLGVYRADTRTERLLSAWQSACTDDRILTDRPNTCGLPNFPDFQAHRHDQAILTILAIQFGVQVAPDPTQFGCIHHDLQPYFDLHRRRHVSLAKKARAALKLGTRLRKLLG